MVYHVEVELSAARTLTRMARGDRQSLRRINKAIEGLKTDPHPAASTKLVGSTGFRLRVGDYRVIYEVNDTVRVVTITKVGHRSDVYEG